MKKFNKKGFTLIELLAVIVLLSVIAVIAYASIGTVLKNSKKSTWSSNCKSFKKAIQARAAERLLDSNVSVVCSSSTCDIYYGLNATDFDANVSGSATGPYSYTVTAKQGGKFDGITGLEACSGTVSIN